MASALAAVLASAAGAQEAGRMGVGLLLGYPTSATAKYWITDTRAVDAGVGASEGLTLHADYLWHWWRVVPGPRKAKLGYYLAAGGRIEAKSDADFGIRTMAGLSYWPGFKRPLEVFVEVGPVLRLAPVARGTVDGGVGLRVYFRQF